MVSSQQVLLISAEPREFSGLLDLCSNVRKIGRPLRWSRSATCAGRQLWMVVNGAGSDHAARAAAVACEACRPDIIISTGFCGALDPALAIGDVFVASAIQAGNRRLPACLPTTAAPYKTGVLATIDHVAATAAEKQALRETGAAAVDMEAAGVAEFALEHQIPFFCVRAVTDLSTENFVTDFTRALRSDGHFATISILQSALGNPWRAFPELFRLRRRCRIAARALGEFIAGCRF